MIDASIDQDFAALERQESLKAARPVAATAEEAPRTIVYRGRLSSLSPRSNQAETRHCSPSPSTFTSAPPPPPSTSTSLSHLRTARLGFAAVVILVIYWLWIRQRRK